VIGDPRYEDFEIKYHYKNPWAHLGLGYAMENRKTEGGDWSPYLKMENIDPKWLEAVAHKPEVTTSSAEVKETLGEAVQGGLGEDGNAENGHA